MRFDWRGTGVRFVRAMAALAPFMLAMSMPDAARAGCALRVLAKLPVKMEGLRASVPVSVNGQETSFWLDSGAFFSIMSKAKAAELGLKTSPLAFGFYITGIGGSTTAEYTKIKSFGLAGHTISDVDFFVGGSDAGNGLIGLNFLAAADTEYDLANGLVQLVDPKDCQKANLAYWAGDRTISVADLKESSDRRNRHIYADGAINGRKVRILFDTGAPTSILSLRAARSLGIDMTAPDVVASANMSGIGTRSRQSWIVRLDSFELGGETIQNTPIRVIDDGLGASETDVILGADFFLAHHIFVSRSQGRIYFTYNGGPIFSLSTDGEVGRRETRHVNMGGDDSVADPTDANGFARRGNARAVRRDWTGAIADLSEALRLEPNSPAYLKDRANAYAQSGQLVAARRDIDAALRIAPRDRDLIVARAFERIATGDVAGALADAETAVSLTPPGSLDNMALLSLFERANRPDRALALIDRIIALHRQDKALGSLLNARCWWRGLANVSLDKALDDCDDAIRRDGRTPAYLDSRAMVKFRLRDYAGALSDFDGALAAIPNLPSSLYLRGLTRKAIGQVASGDEDIAAAQALDPVIARRFAGFN